MLRILLTIVLPVALPFVAYGIYLILRRRRMAGGGLPEEPPWPWLLGAGVVLLAIVLGVARWIGGYSPGTELSPPSYQGGEVVPGGPAE